jgi:alpha-galactosidase
MIYKNNDLFFIETKDTSYCFRVMPSGHLEHLYYGKKINVSGGFEPLIEKTEFIGGSQIAYSKEFPAVGLENLCLEMSSYGKGDIREPFVEITHEDGTSTVDFLFKEARLLDQKEALKSLPSAYLNTDLTTECLTGSRAEAAERIAADRIEADKNEADKIETDEIEADKIESGKIETAKIETDRIEADRIAQEKGVSLEIELLDQNYGITLVMVYSVFYESNVITRSVRVKNDSKKSITLNRIMSQQLDFDTSDFITSTFHGAWAREMNRFDTPLQPGILMNDSKAGISSNRSNPFFMLARVGTTEDHGDCYGFNLIYSGNHYAAMEVGSMGKLRVIQGINPQGFEFLLKPGETFEAPEAVMTYSDGGYTGMSHNMHHFIRNHIVRGEWKDKLRPILINSWEANYFKFNEGKLLKQAKAAREAGIELFVLDDGWFGKRNDDTSSLGDWNENKDKLSNGLKGLAEKINSLGMQFGIWVEPEMVSEDSDCFRSHPDWAVKIPGTKHSCGRNQMILDLTREEVRSYLITEMSRVFSSANISYVKWDMNRIFSDRYSPSLGIERQKEFDHRYILGLYQILDTLMKRFPKILFESCAAGGSRFDLGMLCYMPQIWASDNTDAISRTAIQTGYSYGYPMSVLGAHVSGCPNHQTLRNTSIETRFEVAAFGLLGYECNLSDLSPEEKKSVSDQIAFYKEHQRTFQFGDFYRIKSNENGIYQWLTVAPDKEEAIGLYLQKEVTPNFTYGKFIAKGLDGSKRYHFTNRQQIYNIKEFGDLINMISPVHIKKDSLAHNIIAMVKKMPGEVEDCTACGNVFNHAGVKLKQSFGGAGYNENIRLFQDNATRMYLWQEIK